MRNWFARIAIVFMLSWSGAAQANALKDSWECAKASGNLAIKSQTDLYKKAEAMADKAGPLAICLAKTGPEGQALAATSSALTALRLAKPSLLPKGQCESRIKGIATKPFAQGIAALMPNGGAKSSLLSAANSDSANQLVWDQIGSAPPPFSSIPNQIECGCLVSDGALTLTDISEITNAIANTSNKCAGMLDSLGLGFINDIGSYAGKLAKSLAYGLSDKWDEVIGGQSDPAPPGAVFKMFFGDHLDGVAINMAKYPSNWQSKTYGNQQGWKCNYNMNSGQWEGQCYVTLDQLNALCADYYDNHKMSASNAKKTCNSYRDTLLAAATPKSKQYAAIAALPSLYNLTINDWLKTEWLWRFPTTYSPGTYDFDNGNVSSWAKSDPQAGTLRNQWADVVGSPFTNPTSVVAGQKYEANGILAISRALVLEVGNDPQKATALAFASAISPLQDKLRKAWGDNRKYVAFYNLREWYPKPTFGFRYGCASGEIEAACAAAMEAKFDKQCFTPLSELYIAGTMGIGFPARYNGVKNKCSAQLAPILAATAKLDANAAAATQGKCSERLGRDEAAACNAKARKSYYDCAAIALKQGKDDAGQCLAARQLGADILKQLENGSKPKPAEEPSRKP
jgi:hypothetical protein